MEQESLEFARVTRFLVWIGIGAGFTLAIAAVSTFWMCPKSLPGNGTSTLDPAHLFWLSMAHVNLTFASGSQLSLICLALHRLQGILHRSVITSKASPADFGR